MLRSLQLGLILSLALLVSGLPALARVPAGCGDGCEDEQTSSTPVHHSDDEEDGGCCQGSPICVNCGCCPVRSAPSPSSASALLSLPPPTRTLVATSAEPIVAEPGDDIFHPPRS